MRATRAWRWRWTSAKLGTSISVHVPVGVICNDMHDIYIIFNMIIIYVSYTGSCGHIYTLYIYIHITFSDYYHGYSWIINKKTTMCMYMSEVTSSNPTFHHFRLARSPPGVTIGAVGGMPWGAKASIRKFPTSGLSGHLGIGDERPATIPQVVSVVSVASEHRKEVIHLNMDSSKFIYVPI